MGSWLPWGLQWAPGCLGRRPGRSPGGGVTSARPGRLGPMQPPGVSTWAAGVHSAVADGRGERG